MSLLSRSWHQRPAHGRSDGRNNGRPSGREPSLYLTDGITLYRFLGAAASGMGEMVELEECRSLTVTVVPIGDLRARRLRVVKPTADV